MKLDKIPPLLTTVYLHYFKADNYKKTSEKLHHSSKNKWKILQHILLISIYVYV